MSTVIVANGPIIDVHIDTDINKLRCMHFHQTNITINAVSDFTNGPCFRMQIFLKMIDIKVTQESKCIEKVMLENVGARI